MSSSSRRDYETQAEEERIRAIAATLSASTSWRFTRLNDDECVELYQAYLEHINLSGLPPDLEELDGSQAENEVEAARFRRSMALTCKHRRLMVTESGRLGVGPNMMKAGDIVAVLYASTLHVVLRPHRSGNATHQLVGFCYVHSIMDGEALQADQSQQIADEVFHLGEHTRNGEYSKEHWAL